MIEGYVFWEPEVNGARGRGLGGFVRNLDGFGVPPQSIQIVIGAGLFGEHVNQVIAVVGQHPLGVLKTFHADRMLAAFLQLAANLFGDGLNLFRVATGADHEEVGEGGDIAQI